MNKLTAAALSLALSLSACATPANTGNENSGSGFGPKAAIGGLAGAGLGAWAGSNIGRGGGRTAAMVGGGLLGAILGASIGRSLDRADQAYAMEAERRAYAAQVGQTVYWQNQQSGNYGTITPMREGYAPAVNATCREFQQTIVVAGRSQQGYGTACRQPDGSWRIVNQ